MKNSSIRVRFAPAPTGMMHLGNIRTALMNFLFARQRGGSFVIRLEDTDQQRDVDPRGTKIMEDLRWLGLTHDEGPDCGGPHVPYIQSERTAIYQEKLASLIEKKRVYRCFCSQEELEKKRQRQIALKMPPRYDRTCASLSEAVINERLERKEPFIWRFKLDQTKTYHIKDMAHGDMHFDMAHFSDFPLSRQDGSVTFIFANFVDDVDMRMSHVIRGEDHLTNTASQAALYDACNAPLPIFWHLPIICNTDGKKLSKRDFGFSLRDLIAAGFLPEAICNYLCILGVSFAEEVMSMDELIKNYPFDHVSTTGHIKYDVEKLRWFNHKWISRLDTTELIRRAQPFLAEHLPAATTCSPELLEKLVTLVKTDIVTLADVATALSFYFNRPTQPSAEELAVLAGEHLDAILAIVTQHLAELGDAPVFVKNVKEKASQQKIPLKNVFSSLRRTLQGTPHGLALHDLITILGTEEAKIRLEEFLR